MTFREALLWRMLRLQKKWVVAALVFFILNALAILQVTQVTVDMVDKAIVERSEPLGGYIAQILWLAVANLVVGLIQRLVTTRLSYQLEFDLRTRLYRAVQTAPPERLASVAGGQLITRSITDLQLMQRFLEFAPMIVGILPLFVGVSIYMLVINPALAVLAMGGLPINIWLLRRFRTRLWGLSFAELNERAEVAAAIDEPVRGIRVVRAFGQEEYERNRVADVAMRTYRFAMTRWRLLARFDVPLKFAPVVFQGGLLFIGARLVRSDTLTLGRFMLAFQVNAYVVLVAGLVDEAASLWQYLRSAQQRIGEVLAFPRTEETVGAELPPVGGGLRMSGVGVSFDGRRVLRGVDMTVAPGECVVVTGGPSSGKSTLAAVASGALPVDEGELLLDGMRLDRLDPGACRRAVRVASEEPYLFAASVRDNLELGVRAAADPDTLARALRAAAADDFVAELDGGLDGLIGDRGLTLSGGQRQRLGLARALVEPPRVLVLDDALSAVNPSLEVDIVERIRSAYPDVALLCLNRRPGLITIADRHHALPDPDDDPVPAPPLLLDAADLDRLAEAESIVSSLKLSDDDPRVRDDDVEIDTKMTVREVARPFKWVALAALIVLLIQTAVKFAPEYFVGEIADAVKEPSSAATDVRAVILVGVGVVGAFTAYGFRVLAQRCAQGAMYLLRRRVFQRLSRLGIDFYDRELPGEVATRVVYDLDVLQTFVQQSLFLFGTAIATVVVGLTVVLVISPVVFPIVAGVMVVMLLSTIAQYPLITRAYASARDALGVVTSTFEEDFNARDAIRNYDAVDRQADRFVARSFALRQARRRVEVINASFSDIAQFASQILAALVLYRSGNLVFAGSISVGSVITLRLVATTAATPLSSLSRFYSQFLQVQVSWRRLQEPFGVPILPVERDTAVPCPELRGEVAFEHVGFAYPHIDKAVLHDVSFAIPAGTVASLVGYTGAGKSTIAKLLLRTYDPDAGAVRVDGLDLRDVQLASYRRRIAVVPQDAFLFKGTVASNIAYGRQLATEAEIAAAAAAVCADAVLGSLPNGYATIVEDEGRNLTAAQRQLIALARAWLTGPDLMVLDEATSCLDARLEKRVLEAVGRLGCTTLMVTHRDNVVAASDLVIVLDAGRVAEMGPPSELRGAGGAYDRLWVQEPVVDLRDDAPVSATPAPTPIR